MQLFHSFISKFAYLPRTNPNADPLLQPLEDVIQVRLVGLLLMILNSSSLSYIPAHLNGQAQSTQPIALLASITCIISQLH